MKTRVISALVAAALLLGALAVSVFWPPMLHLVAAAVSAVAAYEIAGAAGIRNVKSITAASMLAAAALPFTMLVPNSCVPLVYGYVLVLFGVQLKVHRTVPIPDLLTTAAVSLAVPFSLMQLVCARELGGSKHGLFYVFMLLLSAWSSDIGAYLVGVRWGRHKLCPQISPKKTIEGFLGGLIGCVVIMEAVAALYAYVIMPGTGVSWLAIAIVAVCCAVISVLGDLSFSLLKRHYGIKDYGTIMPGHGGALDRFDSVIFVAPLFTLLTQYLPIIHV